MPLDTAAAMEGAADTTGRRATLIERGEAYRALIEVVDKAIVVVHLALSGLSHARRECLRHQRERLAECGRQAECEHGSEGEHCGGGRCHLL